MIVDWNINPRISPRERAHKSAGLIVDGTCTDVSQVKFTWEKLNVKAGAGYFLDMISSRTRIDTQRKKITLLSCPEIGSGAIGLSASRRQIG